VSAILVIDVGTSSVRAAVVSADGRVEHVRRRPTPAAIPFPGLVEFDAAAVATAALDAARECMAACGERPAGLGVTTQRASTVAWHAGTGQPLGPGLGWQDLRTVGKCLELQTSGWRFSPSESATKFAWHVEQAGATAGNDLRLGTVDSWIVWNLTAGERHITDASNAGVTGLYGLSAGGWRSDALKILSLDPAWLPSIVDTSGDLGVAHLLDDLPLHALVGDQQASLIGQSCTVPGLAKATFGTGGMLDVCLGATPPTAEVRSDHGCFPIVAWQIDQSVAWGSEAVMLSAGTAVDWLVEDMQILGHVSESATVAAACEDTGGVIMVPALLGLGTPHWDFGARGALFGLTRGTDRSQLVRAVLEGVAHSGADLLEATELDTGQRIDTLRVDGGMSANHVFVQALADFCARPIEVSRELEATTLGAGYLAGLALGTWTDTDQIAAAWSPKMVIEPSGRSTERDRWREAVARAGRWYPELSAINF